MSVLEFQEVPEGNPVAATKLAVEALTLARDCLKAAGASDRCIGRVRLALSSAKGAVRHAEGKAVR